ncbi:hypothetical protein NZ47_13240 [Anaerovibrio lipolyticus]|uniref:Uncharacterized protein n=1 Tax=Anaerovibrio lipolyticus TaxID=82374 RepID=A0A0B2JQ38_9FIRM|nr:hypothetical protein [Anaerovibrio lipolyticus]KHM48461.1 hypothetical protein NZ47_13240 [Anaerovibrio lipolyticus]
MEKLMNKMDNMELDKVAGGSIRLRPRPLPRSGCHDSNANSMAANVDETQNASGLLGSSMVGK